MQERTREERVASPIQRRERESRLAYLASHGARRESEREGKREREGGREGERNLSVAIRAPGNCAEIRGE